jgi:hypothetical protein
MNSRLGVLSDAMQTTGYFAKDINGTIVEAYKYSSSSLYLLSSDIFHRTAPKLYFRLLQSQEGPKADGQYDFSFFAQLLYKFHQKLKQYPTPNQATVHK